MTTHTNFKTKLQSGVVLTKKKARIISTVYIVYWPKLSKIQSTNASLEQATHDKQKPTYTNDVRQRHQSLRHLKCSIRIIQADNLNVVKRSEPDSLI